MKTTAQLLNDMKAALPVNEGFNWCAMKPDDVSLAIKTIEVLQKQLADAASKACHCEAGRGYDLTAHIDRVEKRGDIRNVFARQAALSETHNARG